MVAETCHHVCIYEQRVEWRDIVCVPKGELSHQAAGTFPWHLKEKLAT